MSFGNSNAYVYLRGEYAEKFRFVLKVDWLPIVSLLTEGIDCEEYGELRVLKIDAARLSVDQKERLIRWIISDGDTPNRDMVQANVEANRACYLVSPGDKPEIIHHDPDAWG